MITDTGGGSYKPTKTKFPGTQHSSLGGKNPFASPIKSNTTKPSSATRVSDAEKLRDKKGFATAANKNKDKDDGLKYTYNSSTNKITASEDLREQRQMALAAEAKKNKQTSEQRRSSINKNVGDSDGDKIAGIYDVWDSSRGVPTSVNTRSELLSAQKKLKSAINNASAVNNPNNKDDIRALRSQLATVNSRISKLSTSASSESISSKHSASPARSANGTSKDDGNDGPKANGTGAKSKSSGGQSSAGQNPQPLNNGVAGKLDNDTKMQFNILGKFEKAFGSAGMAQYNKAIDAMTAANPGGIRIVGNRGNGNGNYRVEVKDEKGNWTSSTSAVTAKLAPYADYSGMTADQKADAIARIQTGGSATERHILARFSKAYGGDVVGQNAMYTATNTLLQQNSTNNEIAKEFGKRGEPGYFLAVKDKNGKWTSNGDAVSDALAKVAPPAAGSTTLDPKIKNIITSASGTGVGAHIVKDFSSAYGSADLGERAFYASIDAMTKSKPGSVREFGKRGTPGHYVEVSTGSGWSGNINTVSDALSKYAPSIEQAKKLPSINRPSAGSSTASSVIESINPAAGATIDVGEIARKARIIVADGDSNKSGQVTTLPVGNASPVSSGDNKLTIQPWNSTSAGNAAKKASTISVPSGDARTNSASDALITSAADRNENGKLSTSERAKFNAIADADASGDVSKAEAQAFSLIDTNDNGKIGKKELEAFRQIDANHDGNLTRSEAKAALKAQIDSVQDKRTHDLAQSYLAKSSQNGGGSDVVDQAAAALVSAGKTESSLPKTDKTKKS